MSKKQPSEIAESNAKVYAEGGYRLSYDYETWVTARYPERRLVLRNGLGGGGYGVMWQDDLGKDEAGYEDAEIVTTDERAFELHQSFRT